MLQKIGQLMNRAAQLNKGSEPGTLNNWAQSNETYNYQSEGQSTQPTAMANKPK